MNNFGEQAKNWWNERSFGQKFSLIFLILALVAVTTYLFAISNQPDWEVLKKDLSPNDSSAVAGYLKDSGIIYKMSDNGTTILVPKEIIDETRLEIAGSDLIKEEVKGFEDINNTPITQTEMFQKLTRQKLLQGEIVRTIQKIRGVKNARITIAEPERSIFTSQDEKPSASVMLVLEAGAKIKQEQIKAIKNLVSHAIPRLRPENVFVSDQYGNVLSEELSNSTSTLDDLKTKQEKNIEKKVNDVLVKLVGTDNVKVAVTAEMNFDRTTAKIERYIPTTQAQDGTASGVLISEQLLEEKYTGKDGKNPGGIPGTASNITDPTYVATSGADANKSSDYNKNSKVKNFEVSKEIKDIIYAPGQLERITVAVAVNKVLTSKEQEKIERLVATASGADLARGDVINVTGMSFAGMEEIQKRRETMQKELEQNYWINLALEFAPIVLLLTFGGVALGILYSLIKQPVDAEDFSEPDEPMYDFPESPEILEAASIPVIEAKLDPEIERMRNEINSFIMNDASEAARLLLTYIKE